MYITKLTLLYKSGDIQTDTLSPTFSHVKCCNSAGLTYDLELDLDFSTHEKKLKFEDTLNSIGYNLVARCEDVPFGEHLVAETTIVGNTKFLHLVSPSTGSYTVLPIRNENLDVDLGHIQDPNNILAYLGTQCKTYKQIREDYLTCGGKFSEAWLKRVLKSLEYCSIVEYSRSKGGWLICQTK